MLDFMALRPAPLLLGDTVTLRAPRPDDVEARRRLGLHPEIQWGLGYTIREPRELTHDEARAWYRRMTDIPDATSWVVDIDGAMAGVARLHTLIPAERRASFSITLMAPKYLGRGLGSESIHLVLVHAFETLGMHRVGLRVLARNTRALTAYRRAGFVAEGRERETVEIDGAWQDDLIMGILHDEYVVRRIAGEPGSDVASA
jgi:RimJ/RimL family protein N-acetyltransferase